MFRGGGHGEMSGGGMLGHLARELNLTDAQTAQVKQITDAFHESTKALHEQLSKTGGPLEGLQEGAFDEAAVRAAALQYVRKISGFTKPSAFSNSSP